MSESSKKLREIDGSRRYPKSVEYVFTALYSLEQLGLLLLISLTNYNPSLIVSVFAIVILTTFAFDKLRLRNRIIELEKELLMMSMRKDLISTEAKMISEEYERIKGGKTTK